MHDEFIPAQSLRMTGKHHEVYLSDSRRTPAAKLKTILRQPVTQAARSLRSETLGLGRLSPPKTSGSG